MKLLDICDISGNPVKKFIGNKKYIATGDVIDNVISSYTIVNYDNKPSRANVEISKNELLFAKMINTKKVLLSNDDNIKNIYSTGFYCLRPKENVDIKYLYYLINSKSFNNQKDKNCSGATQKAISNDGLAKIVISDIPNYNIQKRIANILEKIDSLISVKKQQMIKFDELIKSQFVEMFGNVYINDKKWNVYDKIGNHCILNPKKNEISEINKNTLITFLPMQNVSVYGVLDYSIERTIREVWKGFTYFRDDDVLFAKITPCMENGKGAVARKLKNGIGFGTTEFHVIRPKKEINSIWIYYVLADKKFRSNAEKNMTGSAGQKRVPISFIENYKISIPPIELQNKFADIVEQIDKQKFEFENSLKKLEELQASLMQEYFG